MLAIAGCTYVVLNTVLDYDNYETVVQNKVVAEKPLILPAVFICPIVKTSLNKLFMQCTFDSKVINCADHIQMVNVTNAVGEMKACYKINGGEFVSWCFYN